MDCEQMDFKQVKGDATMYCRYAKKGDLAGINQVITDAVMVWTIAERAKRLIIPVLCYSEDDFGYYKTLVWINHQQIIGIAVWDSDRPIETEKGYALLLHGLYVSPDFQGRGIGKALMAYVKELVLDAVAVSVLDGDLEGDIEGDIEGLLIKAERVSISFFEHCGLERMFPLSMEDYPYQFWQPLQA